MATHFKFKHNTDFTHVINFVQFTHVINFVQCFTELSHWCLHVRISKHVPIHVRNNAIGLQQFKYIPL